jgi:hypothetical protein
VSRKPLRIPRSAAWDLTCPTTAPPVLAPAPDLDAIRREAFMASWKAAAWHFARAVPTDPTYFADRADEAYTAWQAQRRGETP